MGPTGSHIQCALSLGQVLHGCSHSVHARWRQYHWVLSATYILVQIIFAEPVERKEKVSGMTEKGKCQHNTESICTGPKPKLDTPVSYPFFHLYHHLWAQGCCLIAPLRLCLSPQTPLCSTFSMSFSATGSFQGTGWCPSLPLLNGWMATLSTGSSSFL